jgi:hypothetical protein
MSKFNPKKTGFETGEIAGVTTNTAGKYSDYELLRRVTLTNLLFESNYYQSADQIMMQIESLVPKVDPLKVIDLARECRFEQKLRHTPLWLLILVNEYHNHPIKDALAEVCTRPDMTIDTLSMVRLRKGQKKLRKVPKSIKKGLANAFERYDEYQISKYKKENNEISLVDVVNLVHPKPTQQNEEALRKLVRGELAPPNTWEARLSSGEDKAKVFSDMIERNKLGSMAILRNLRNMKEAGLERKQIRKAISQVNSFWLTPLNFLAAQRIVPEYTSDINEAIKRTFSHDPIPGTTILAIDVSGSMGGLTSAYSNFSRMDLAFSMAALGSYIFEDIILVFTAGVDYTREGIHFVWSNDKGLGIFNDYNLIAKSGRGGGIFTYQLCEWLKHQGYSNDADRLVVISDSQDIDAAHGMKKKPDTSPYKTSYIIDISTNTHGIKTGVWTAEISGWSDKLFHYIKELEKQ